MFAFLTTDYAFRCTHAELNLISYGSEALYVVVYHDPLSCEVGVDAGKPGDGSERKRSLTLVELMHLANPQRAKNLRCPAAVTPEQMRPALLNLAGLLKTYGAGLLGGIRPF